MGITLKKANGDLFIHPETGRPEAISGVAKVDQELADLYLSDFDVERNWGSSLSLSQLGSGQTSIEQARAVLFLRLQQANDRIISKQAQDPNMTSDEFITQFSDVDVIMDVMNQALIFFSIADVGTEVIEKVIAQSFKPISLKHVLPPPAGIISKD